MPAGKLIHRIVVPGLTRLPAGRQGIQNFLNWIPEILRSKTTHSPRHCESRSDVAIQKELKELDRDAPDACPPPAGSLAMTKKWEHCLDDNPRVGTTILGTRI